MAERRHLRSDLFRAQVALDRLPAGSVVLDRFGHAWQSERRGYWYRAYGDDTSVASSGLCSLAPFRVMREGEVLR